MLRLQSSIPYLALFLCSCLFISLLKYPFQELSDARDPYYHIAHANAYRFDTALHYPQLTHFSTHPADLWYGYHLLLAVSFTGIAADDIESQIARTIQVHIFLSSLLIVVLAQVAIVYVRTVFPLYKLKLQEHGLSTWQPQLSKFLLITIMLSSMFMLSSAFFYRAVLQERPHVLMMLLVTFALLCLIRRHYRLLALLAALSVLCYSMSPLIFLPSIILFLGWLLTDRTIKNLRESLTPLFYTFIGYSVGLLLHPDTWGYLLNGVLFTSFASLDSLFWFLPVGAEFSQTPVEMTLQAKSSWGLLIPLIVLSGMIWHRYNEKTTEKSSQHLIALEAGFCMTAFALGIVSLMIYRAVEYAVPLLFITTISFVLGYLPSLGHYIHAQLTISTGVVSSLYRDVVSNLRAIPRKLIKITLYSSLFLLGLLFIGITYSNLHGTTYGHDRLKEAAEFIARDANRGMIILGSFDMYPQAVLYGTTNYYANGMDPRMQYFFDSEHHAELDSFFLSIQETKTPPAEINPATIASLASFFKQKNITHLLIDFNDKEAERIKNLDQYPFLRLQYESQAYPAVHVYTIN